MRLDSLGNLLARKTGLILSFNAGTINPGTKITFSGTEVEPGSLLLYLHKRYRLSYKTIGNHIVLYRDTTSGREVQIIGKIHESHISRKGNDIPDKQKVTRVVPLKKEIEPPLSSVLPNIEMGISLRNLSPPSLVEVEKVLFIQNHISRTITGEPKLYSERKLAHISDMPHKAITQGDGFRGSNNHFFASAGLTVGEVLYANPQIKIGLPQLFALVAWETNFKTSGFFYGLGSSAKLSDNWNVQISASRGSLSKEFRWPAYSGDTIGRIKARLSRIDIQAEKHLNERWVLQFGPSFNFMNSKYSLQDSSQAIFFPSVGVSRKMNIVNAPYTLNKSYEEKTGSGKKMWIGLRIGLFYFLW